MPGKKKAGVQTNSGMVTLRLDPEAKAILGRVSKATGQPMARIVSDMILLHMNDPERAEKLRLLEDAQRAILSP